MLCGVCDDYFEDPLEIKNVRVRGLQTFIEASKNRGDNKWQIWQDLQTIRVHEECRKIYTKAEYTAAAKKRKLMPPITDFIIARCCFICGSECDKSIEKRKKKDRRRKIYAATFGSGLKQRVLDACSQIPSDPEAQLIQKRLESVNGDLSSVGAHYHSLCLMAFISKATQRKKNPLNPNSLQKIFDFINQSDYCQWKIDDLITVAEDPGFSEDIVKKHLKAEYGKEIYFLTNNGTTIVTYVGEGVDKELKNYFLNNLPDQSEEELNTNIIKRAAQIIRAEIWKKQYGSLFPKAKNFFKADHRVNHGVPKSLKIFVDEITLKKECNVESYLKDINGLSRAIALASRPSSFEWNF